jgi:hypothetical protein
MIRRCPPATVVSLLSACMLSWVCALATICSVALTLFAFSYDLNSAMAASTSRCAYHTSRKCCLENARIAVR